VRANLFYNVDLIKITIEEDFTQAEVTAIVDEAHRQQLRVAVHATTTASIQMAIDAGADSIEHANYATDEQLKIMREQRDLSSTSRRPGMTALIQGSRRQHRDVSGFRSELVVDDDRARQRARLGFSGY
jgi:imidazolonepropionase-like amidohydrolase